MFYCFSTKTFVVCTHYKRHTNSPETIDSLAGAHIIKKRILCSSS